MVIIREIRTVRSFACIVLESGEQYWIRQDDLSSSGFVSGAETDRESFLSRIRVLQYPRALNLAVSMLARRPCSKGEILSRLRLRRVCDEVAGLVLYKLEKEKLIDDEAFSEQWMRYRLEHGYGPASIRRELKMKGVPAVIIEAVMNKADPETGKEKAVESARKIWKRVGPGSDLCKARQKVITALVRKGYDWDTAAFACRTAEKEEE